MGGFCLEFCVLDGELYKVVYSLLIKPCLEKSDYVGATI